MKKYIFSLIALLLAPIAVEGAAVSPRTAKNLAEKVLEGKRIKESPTRIKGRPSSGNNLPQPYYVFNAVEEDGGYAIIAGDDRLPALLGYSMTGHLDMDDAPEAMLAMLQLSVDNVGKLNSHDVQKAGKPVVGPLLGEINWGQDAPFNTMCPSLSGGSKAYVGCVATAMAQMMRYYSFPPKGTGSHSYIDNGMSLSADFGATEYEWSDMPATVPETPTDSQIKAYSTLSAHLGVAVDMQYAASGSGAYTHLVAPALRNYFGYSPSLRMHTREYYNTDEWMSMIRTELDAGRPVYYSASSEDAGGGHAFVCDGYDSEGYVHINWGWYGRSNGYFYINHLNPGELGEGGGSGAYNVSQEILTGMKPADNDGNYTQLLFGATRFSCDIFGSFMTIMTYIENLDTQVFDGELYVVLTDDKEQNIAATIYSQAYDMSGFSSGRPASQLITLREVPVTVDLPDGEYHIKLAYRATKDNTVHILRHPVGLPSYVKCKVAGKTIVTGDKHVPVPNVSMLTPLVPDGEIYARGSARFSVNLKNNSSDFRLTSLELTLKNRNNPEQVMSKTFQVNIYDLSEKSVIMEIDLPETLEEGEYEVVLSHEKYAAYPFSTFNGEPTIVTVLPESEHPVLRLTDNPDPYNVSDGSKDFKRGDMFYADLFVKNYGSEGECMVLMRAIDRQNPEKQYVLKGDAKSWKQGESFTVRLSNTLALDPSVYDCSFYYMASDGKEVPMKSAPIEFVLSESDSPAIEITDFQLPPAMKRGESFPYSITVKALRSVSGTLYVRLRQYTYTNGELIYMGSVRMNAGETQTISKNYSPSQSLSDGRYLTMVELKDGNKMIPASGYNEYYKEVTLVDSASGVIETDVEEVECEPIWFTIDGIRIKEPLMPGIYICRKGDKSTKMIVH